jgi:aspartyl-tRNA(Asn)/glutamyl-tRNA(Gln) amidotransferase subunit B
MEEGSFRCDANVSIKPAGSSKSLAKVEVKNMNSFKAVYRAMEYEAERQRKVAEEGGRLVQETRGWVEERGATQSQRSKEYAHDYRYFPEPDLPPLTLMPPWVEEIRSRLPELPEAKRDRFVSQYGLPLYDANLLTNSKALADYFEVCVSLSREGPTGKRAKTVSNWLLGDFARLLNLNEMEINESKVAAAQLVELLDLTDQGTLSRPTAKKVFEEMFNTGKPAKEIAAEQELTQIGDAAAVAEVVRQVTSNNRQAVADYKAGKEQAIKFLVGQVMKETRGRANPKMVAEILQRELEAE